MKLLRCFCRGTAVVWPQFLLGFLLLGCGSVKNYDDPVNPKHPYAFPGQTPTAATVATTTPSPAPEAVIQPATASAPTTAAPAVPVAVMPVIPGSTPPVVSATTPTPAPTAPVTSAVTPVIPTPTANPGPNVAPESFTVLRSGDTIVLNFSDLPLNNMMPPQTTELDKDGKITLPYNVTVYAVGKNTRQLEQEIRGEYVPKYFKYLTVSVRPEMRYFHVNGEVKAPSMYPWKGEPTLLRAIGAAGGFTDWANRKKVQLNRANGQKFTINCWDAEKDGKKDLPVFPGDYIYVPRKGPLGSWGL